MSEQTICPVCGKVGIPDYHKENVICPCCGTDLSVYKSLADYKSNIEQKRTKNKPLKIATAVSTAVAIISLLILSISTYNETRVATIQNKRIEDLTFSRNKLSVRLDSVLSELNSLKTKSRIYVVKKGDSPWKISRILFGTGNKYKKIEAIMTKKLQPGDTLKIK